MKAFTLILLMFCYSSFAQLRHYGSNEYEDFLKKSGSQPLSKTLTTKILESRETVNLSVIFVVLVKDISKEQLLKQVMILNEDFGNQTFVNASNQNPHYRDLACDTEIRFCENFEMVEDYSNDPMDFEVALAYARKYSQLYRNNILVFVTNLERMSGFAQKPSYTEGNVIFIDKNYLPGSRLEGYEFGKTLSHLMGTYLGLGDFCDCLDDGIADTPMMAVEHFDTEDGWSSCYRYVVPTMPQNFMYNAPDRHLNMFTLGQKERMREVLANQRPYLLESQPCK
jgi:hypothetical protein